MIRNILWNGFEIKKGTITTSIGVVPYISYCPLRTDQSVNIAIHGEGQEKEEWLCFNSTSKLGNLLKESIKRNSAFIAFDLYGHGEWINDQNYLNISNLSKENLKDIIIKTSKGIAKALPIILKEEGLTSNPISFTGYSIGSNVALNLNFILNSFKTILISPYLSEVSTNSENILIFRGNNDQDINNKDFLALLQKLPKDTEVTYYDSDKQVPEKWINKAKEFIYS